jgi:hypothetical protein
MWSVLQAGLIDSRQHRDEKHRSDTENVRRPFGAEIIDQPALDAEAGQTVVPYEVLDLAGRQMQGGDGVDCELHRGASHLSRGVLGSEWETVSCVQSLPLRLLQTWCMAFEP